MGESNTLKYDLQAYIPDSNTIRTITVGYGITPYQSYKLGVVDYTTDKEFHLSSSKSLQRYCFPSNRPNQLNKVLLFRRVEVVMFLLLRAHHSL